MMMSGSGEKTSECATYLFPVTTVANPPGDGTVSSPPDTVRKCDAIMVASSSHEALPVSARSLDGPASVTEVAHTPIRPHTAALPVSTSNSLPRNIPHGRGHIRSASHGSQSSSAASSLLTYGDQSITVPVIPSSSLPSASSLSRPSSALKKGHQRALSHGSSSTCTGGILQRGRLAGSRTDFILPPGHRDDLPPSATSSGRQFPRHLRQPSRGSESLFPHGGGHSRQASRSESIYTLRQTSNAGLFASVPFLTTLWNGGSILFWRRWRGSQAPTSADATIASVETGALPPASSGVPSGLAGASGSSQDAGSANTGKRSSRRRTVVPNHLVSPDTPVKRHPNRAFPTNRIRTTKYTLLSFLPKNLFEQFHRMANLYFLFIVLLNWFPAINAFGKEVAMIPVAFVLGVTAIKDMFEDRRRHASDKRINNSTCRVYKSDQQQYKRVLWKDVRVGDLVHLSNNEMVPADILLLRSSDPQGACFLDTCNLDGETNLKQRVVVRGFAEKQSSFQPDKFQSVVEVDGPTTRIYRFHGEIVHPSGERVAVSTENLLLRECCLKNTDFVEGIVVYAGHESKAMLNNGGPRYKRSSLERQMNVDVVWCVVILLVLCIVGAVGCKLWLSSYDDQPFSVPFIPYTSNPAIEGVLAFWTFIIILQVMIPLSLYVTLEMTKLIQVYHIHHDVELYDRKTNKRIECRALNIPEELGQIQYLFSDKTGTLTENKMIFQRCTVGGVDYSHTSTNSSEKRRPGSPTPIVANTKLKEELAWEAWQAGAGAFPSDVRGGRLAPPPTRVREFLTLMAVCNTVVVTHHPHVDEMNASGVIEPKPKESAVKDQMEKSKFFWWRQGNVPRVRKRSTSASGHGRSTPHDATLEGKLPLSSPTPSGAASTPSPSSVSANTLSDSKYSRLDESRSVTPSPPPGSGARPRHLEFLPPSTNVSRPLSPIQSSSETATPEESPAPPRLSRSGGSDSVTLLRVPGKRSGASKEVEDGREDDTDESEDQSRVLSKGWPGNGDNLAAGLGIRGKSAPVASSPSHSVYEDVRPIYEAESPDELALVNAAYAYGCRLLHRTIKTATISLPGEGVLELEVLKVLPFDSSRKCMSVVLRHPNTREIFLYCKGADSAIISQLARTDNPWMQQTIMKTQQHLNGYARNGLRVLMMGRRSLSEVEYNEWLKAHHEVERETENRERKIRDSYSRLECNLTLLGATGIEDRLQDGVPETISALIRAGIVVWVLTGDKPETAVNVAYSARLFSPQMRILKLTAHSREGASAMIAVYLAEIQREASGGVLLDGMSVDDVTGNSEGLTRPTAVHLQQRALVVDGKTLTYILPKHCNLVRPFLELTRYCSSVLCCRVTPLQKSYIVRVVKEELNMRTLAIGDGANDVSMIQAADVGIGISGQEGMQAVMASDFAISRFRFLERALLVHGHWCYDRLSRMVLYFFYKNATFVFLIFWFQLYCGFSGSVMIDQMYLLLYNLLFTSLPPIAVGAYDRDAPDDLLLSHKALYRQGRLGLVYQTHSFWATMADSLYQSIVIFFVTEAAYHDTDVGIWEFGTTITTSCMFVMLLHVAVETRSWTVIHFLFIMASIIAFYIFSIIYNTLCIQCFGLPSNYWVIVKTMGSVVYWAVIILSSVLALLPRFVVKGLKGTLFPSDVMVALQERRREEELLLAGRDRLGDDGERTFTGDSSGETVGRGLGEGSLEERA
ncbi:phospholipid-transporting ATPase VD isoform X2 [Ischnura elegans]|uniref:phospholipid-transporting ATPase VD isoform X2 n=1 Tax=Ischnura elegans TaxID=197161 RepID=UPI001ED872BC|nr:phospholipid-transporting ATPase VD isoform X2 [Ischnura elegans]